MRLPISHLTFGSRLRAFRTTLPTSLDLADGSGRSAVVAIVHASQRPYTRAVRPVPLKIVAVSKNNSQGAELMAGEWLEKLQRYAEASEVVIRPNPKNAADPKVAVQAEGERVLKMLRPQDRVVVLDERGKEATSEKIAEMIAEAGDEGVGALVFCIGGPHGHSSEVRKRADSMLRLSACVLNHQVARVVLLEQLYRGWTILKGEPYHH
ncbi:Ribosomal RNA large subunit methyltransferase H [Coccomyxa sp. Obi]|nr:Ribosomal RNA large subunit methyltransferase H [Coccomyxa sp. Obi]